MAEPNNPLVEFLSAYGPAPSSSNLYDEFVVDAAARTDCTPLVIDQPLVEEIVSELRSDAARSVILTGTAGDGKTYTARKILDSLSNGDKKWGNTDKEFRLFFSGKTIRFIKDLSELNEKDKDAIFPDVVSALRGDEGADLFIICVNDGHLLKFFRDREPAVHSEGESCFYDTIREMLRHEIDTDKAGRFRLFNMSRQPHDEIIDQIFDQVFEHKDWGKCSDCTAFLSEERPCPIRVNLDVIGDKSRASMRVKIKDMIRMAAAGGRHLSVRQLILLTVNILIGDSKIGSVLLTCNKARSRARAEEYRFTNPFSNAFGINLIPRLRQQYGAFAVFEELGIGRETNNYFDESLLSENRKLPDHPIYGEKIFDQIKSRYKNDPGMAAQEFREGLVAQRRQVFFLTASETGVERRRDPWNLCVFKYGAAYIKLTDTLLEDTDAYPPRYISDGILLGLNRVMTGSMTTTADSMWLCKPSGVYLGREMPFLVEKISRGEVKTGPVLRFVMPEVKGKPPSLRIELRQLKSPPEKIAQLDLHPNLFEFLFRVSRGALLASFSNHCLQDVRRFQLAATEQFKSLLGVNASQEIITSEADLQSRPVRLMKGPS